MILKKDPDIFKDKKEFFSEGNEKDVIIKLLEYHKTKKYTDKSNDFKWHLEKKEIIINDLCYAVKVVCIAILKYILTAIYPYFLNEKTMQKFFKVDYF